MSRDITTSFYFLPRDSLWEKEKPYSLKFVPSKDFPGTNRERVEETGILVQDIRGKESSFSFETNGFAVMELEEYGMTYDDFFDDTKVEGLYLKGLGNQLKSFLQAKRTQIFDFVIRKSHADFPIATGEQYPYKQPANILHLDAMPIEAKTQIEILNSDKEANELLKGRYSYVNIWKPLAGPVENWPLALCDRSSINIEEDVVGHDSVFPESVVETGEIHHSVSQRYYYLSDQNVNEALVFLQADSVLGCGTPHASFENPHASDPRKSRESIEVRCLVYY